MAASTFLTFVSAQGQVAQHISVLWVSIVGREEGEGVLVRPCCLDGGHQLTDGIVQLLDCVPSSAPTAAATELGARELPIAEAGRRQPLGIVGVCDVDVAAEAVVRRSVAWVWLAAG